MALSLGANLGPSKRILRTALEALRGHLLEVRVSPLYRTEPVSEIPQPDFYNLAVVGRTHLPPDELLRVLQSLETAAGRVRDDLENGPRQLDIDILLYGGETSEEPHLLLPHPRMRFRRFVLEPLKEIAPDLPVPPDHQTVSQLLAGLPRGERVRQIPWRAP